LKTHLGHLHNILQKLMKISHFDEKIRFQLLSSSHICLYVKKEFPKFPKSQEGKEAIIGCTINGPVT